MATRHDDTAQHGLLLADRKAGHQQAFKYATIAFVAVGVFLVWLLPLNKYPTMCFSRVVFGVPCPTCGVGRSLHALLHGRIRESFYYHPLTIPFLLEGVALWWAERRLSVKGRSITDGAVVWIALVASGALLLVVWVVRLNFGGIP